ncbi:MULTISPECIES: hypothetical protein [unclassified Leptospira]|uniref:hypothetical protein n=1 Tax=unclassified Leptospira TaxID=2633828 RepID=UPI0002BEFC14|nr:MULTISPECIES: hypothetical protein [unclassified Leptospira]EMK00033.1 hypothetical protein LEP1GSC192_1083 [Leptospira sp. B5-022]MCR1795395.1 hypothetical protein [Leptospira sp. id769339]
MITIILNVIPILIFILVFVLSIWDRKQKETFSKKNFGSFFPAILSGELKSDLNSASSQFGKAGYVVQAVGEKLLFQNASQLAKHRNWLWSFGYAEKAENGSIQYKLFINIGSVMTVPAALFVVVFYGMLVQNNIPQEQVSIAPYFFLGFAFFFAISSFISQTIKERSFLKKILSQN